MYQIYFYFGMTLYMFRTVFPSIIRSSRLYIQQQAYVKQILLSVWWQQAYVKQIVLSVWLKQAYVKQILLSVWLKQAYVKQILLSAC